MEKYRQFHPQIFKRCFGHTALSSISTLRQRKSGLNTSTPANCSRSFEQVLLLLSKLFFNQNLGVPERREKPKWEHCVSHNHGWHFDKVLLWSSSCISAVTYEANENCGSHSEQAGSPEISFPLNGSCWINALSLKVLMSWNTGGEGPTCHEQQCCWPHKK